MLVHTITLVLKAYGNGKDTALKARVKTEISILVM